MPSSVVPCSRGTWFIFGCGHCRSVMTPASLSALKLFESPWERCVWFCDGGIKATNRTPISLMLRFGDSERPMWTVELSSGLH